MAAGRVLFGPAFRADGQAWRADLKITYRRRALETHPDRARSVGRGEGELAAEFGRVAEAYRVLSQLTAESPPSSAEIGARAPAARPHPSTGARVARPNRKPAPAPRAAGAEASERQRPAHQEAMPRRKVRFAEFLYYSGRVPWTVFAESIAWQRRQRPPVGRIAVEWGFLEPEDVGRIMEERRVRGAQSVPFGEYAVRLGYLTSFQLLAVLGRQLRVQRRIGEFFVERGLIGAGEIDGVRRSILQHNVRWPR